MTMGEIIQKKRSERGMSQEKLAELVGVSRQAVSKWEVGDAVPDTDKLLPLARALGVSVDELLGNAVEGSVDGSAAAERAPGWFALHWYWLGLALAAWGLVRACFYLVNVVQVLRIFDMAHSFYDMGLPISSLLQEVLTGAGLIGEGGLLDEGLVLGMVLSHLVIDLAIVAAGLLIFFLGRRYVRKKYRI